MSPRWEQRFEKDDKFKCNFCGAELTPKNYNWKHLHKYRYRCKSCEAAYHRAYRATHLNATEASRRYMKERGRARIHELKIRVLSHYSGRNPPQCVHCGYNNDVALTIDHIFGGGKKHLKEIGGGGTAFYRWLERNHYPVGFQTLCFNCQWVKRAEKNETNLGKNIRTVPPHDDRSQQTIMQFSTDRIVIRPPRVEL